MDFNRPLGLVLCGGGALGSWQAGALQALTDAGLSFDSVLGFSAGSLTGAAYAIGLQRELRERWLDVDAHFRLRLQPRLRPPTLFSGEPLWAMMDLVDDDIGARARCRTDLVVMSVSRQDRRTSYWRFTPSGERGWDGPLAHRLVASCAIPWVFPPVSVAGPDGTAQLHIDGGIPGKEWMRWDAVASCRDIIVLEMVRPEEVAGRNWNPLTYYEQKGRRTCRRQMDMGLESLRACGSSARVFRVHPSRRLGFGMLAFRSKHCAPALEQGLEDGRAFLSSPPSFIAAPTPAVDPPAAGAVQAA